MHAARSTARNAVRGGRRRCLHRRVETLLQLSFTVPLVFPRPKGIYLVKECMADPNARPSVAEYHRCASLCARDRPPARPCLFVCVLGSSSAV